jgi:hypothetical protein
LLACINTYTIDDKRKAVIDDHHPVQKSGAGSQLIGRCTDSSGKHSDFSFHFRAKFNINCGFSLVPIQQNEKR